MDPRTVFEGILALVVGPARTAIPRSFCCQSWSATLGASVPVDFHVFESNIDGFAKAVILAVNKRGLLHHHEVHMVPGAHAGIVHGRDFHALPNIRASDFYAGRDTVFGDVHINLVGPGVSAAVLQGDAVRAAGVAVVAGVAPMIDIATLGCQQFKHASISKIERVGAIILRITGVMSYRPGQAFR